MPPRCRPRSRIPKTSRTEHADDGTRGGPVAAVRSMKLVATLVAPAPLEQRAQELAAETSGALAECRMRLVGEPPLPFARLPDADAEALAQRLRSKGWT